MYQPERREEHRLRIQQRLHVETADVLRFDELEIDLGLREVRRHATDAFTLVYLGDGVTPHQLELTWLADRAEAYDLGENEFHLAFTVDDYAAAHALHKEMGCICFENEAMGIYFIADPDGYWLEIVPARK